MTLDDLIKWARSYVPTEAEKEEHRRSFAFGNVALHNPNITRADVDRVADDMEVKRKEAEGLAREAVTLDDKWHLPYTY